MVNGPAQRRGLTRSQQRGLRTRQAQARERARRTEFRRATRRGQELRQVVAPPVARIVQPTAAEVQVQASLIGRGQVSLKRTRVLQRQRQAAAQASAEQRAILATELPRPRLPREFVPLPVREPGRVDRPPIVTREGLRILPSLRPGRETITFVSRQERESILRERRRQAIGRFQESGPFRTVTAIERGAEIVGLTPREEDPFLTQLGKGAILGAVTAIPALPLAPFQFDPLIARDPVKVFLEDPVVSTGQIIGGSFILGGIGRAAVRPRFQVTAARGVVQTTRITGPDIIPAAQARAVTRGRFAEFTPRELRGPRELVTRVGRLTRRETTTPLLRTFQTTKRPKVPPDISFEIRGIGLQRDILGRPITRAEFAVPVTRARPRGVETPGFRGRGPFAESLLGRELPEGLRPVIEPAARAPPIVRPSRPSDVTTRPVSGLRLRRPATLEELGEVPIEVSVLRPALRGVTLGLGLGARARQATVPIVADILGQRPAQRLGQRAGQRLDLQERILSTQESRVGVRSGLSLRSVLGVQTRPAERILTTQIQESILGPRPVGLRGRGVVGVFPLIGGREEPSPLRIRRRQVAGRRVVRNPIGDILADLGFNSR